ncbi:MAG: NADH:ubiquinone oxidoreductase subunit NDUFA12 [Alphaproteobacteria bacterium CG_4_9_14_3_um_filter_47_13]|nr:MAG: NADH:ubiquinone oxidoreductase subunit NDUFA12 [Alphaproteobacteria bacterium CG_4_9_14_3_um_filter_47_13]
MGLLNFLGVLSPVHITLVTMLGGGKKIGTDSSGNQYYRAKPRTGYKHDRRWVIYKNEPQASAVPPEWHGWLHHQTNDVPTETPESYRRDWQKPHRHNMTGTTLAYRPPGHHLKNGQRPAATGDYEAWTPPE